MNAKPSVHVALSALDMTGAGGATITNDKAAEPVPPMLMALMVGENDPVETGVPEISPVDGLQPKPAGRPLAPKLEGLLLAVI